MSRLFLRAGAVLVAAALPALAIVAPAQAAPVEIDLLTANDFHGRLETIGAVGGAAVLAGAVNEFQAANPNTFFVGAGDFIGASTFTSFILDDDPTVNAMNASEPEPRRRSATTSTTRAGPTCVTTSSAAATAHAAAWEYLAANVVLKSTGEPAPETPPYEIIETDGARIGFIGAVTDELPSLVSPAGIVDLDVLPVVESVNHYADQLSDGDDSNGEADVVILLVHEAARGEIEEGANANIDASWPVTRTRPTPTARQPGRPVIQTGQYATNIGHLSFTVDPDTGDVVFDDPENLPLMTCDAGGVCTPNYEPDPEVAEIVAEAVEAGEDRCAAAGQHHREHHPRVRRRRGRGGSVPGRGPWRGVHARQPGRRRAALGDGGSSDR